MLEAAPGPVEERTSPRVGDTRGLCAAVRPAHRTGAIVAVRDLSAHGIGVDRCPQLDPDEVVRFEFWGSDFAWSGTARVAHAEGDRAGLAFLGWDGPVHRPLNRLLSRRLAT